MMKKNNENRKNDDYNLINQIINNNDITNNNETTIILMNKLKYIFSFNFNHYYNDISFVNPKKYNNNEQFGKFIIKVYEYINYHLSELNDYADELIKLLTFINNFTNWLLIQQQQGNFGKLRRTTCIFKQDIDFFKIEESINQDADEDDDGYEIINFIIDGELIESIDATYSIDLTNKIHFYIDDNELLKIVYLKM